MQVVGGAHVAERVEAHRPERQFGRQVPPFGPVDGAKIQRVDESVVLAEPGRITHGPRGQGSLWALRF